MSPLVVLSNKSTFEWKCSYSKVPLMGSWENFFVFNPILMKLGEVVVSMGTTTSPSFIKIGLKTKKIWLEPISGTFECALINNTAEVHGHRQ